MSWEGLLLSSPLEQLHHNLVVSCQADQGMPLRHPDHLVALAKTVVLGGAAGLRVEGVEVIASVKRALPDVPLIGLIKDGPAGRVFITPTLDHVRQALDAGADIVAVDGTTRSRPDGRSLRESVDLIHHRGRLCLGDIADEGDAIYAVESGVDAIATTLYGYTEETISQDTPPYSLLTKLVGQLDWPIIAEGHIRSPEDLRRVIDTGIYCAIVGTAITRPEVITKWFRSVLDDRRSLSGTKDTHLTE